MDTIKRSIANRKRKIYPTYRNRSYRRSWRRSSKSVRRYFAEVSRISLREQVAFSRSENRLLINYLRWYETRILHQTDYAKPDSISSPPTSKSNRSDDTESLPTRSLDEEVLPLDRTGRHLHKSSLSVQKKRDIAETTCRILLGYSQKQNNTISDYVDQCLVIRNTGVCVCWSFVVEHHRNRWRYFSSFGTGTDHIAKVHSEGPTRATWNSEDIHCWRARGIHSGAHPLSSKSGAAFGHASTETVGCSTDTGHRFSWN